MSTIELLARASLIALAETVVEKSELCARFREGMGMGNDGDAVARAFIHYEE